MDVNYFWEVIEPRTITCRVMQADMRSPDQENLSVLESAGVIDHK